MWRIPLLLLLSRFSRVRLCATPETAAHHAPPSLGFSRQEHWSGLPFPSPMQDSEKWKWSHSVVLDSQRLHGLQPTRLLCPWDFPGKSSGVGCHCLLQRKNTTKYLSKTEANRNFKNHSSQRDIKKSLIHVNANIKAFPRYWNWMISGKGEKRLCTQSVWSREWNTYRGLMVARNTVHPDLGKWQ